MPTKRHPDRQLHLIDAENLGQDPRPTALAASAVRATYNQLVGRQACDHVVVACNHGALLNVGCAWLGARLLARSGKDGADLALLDVLATEDVASRYDGVVLGSGDGIFTDAVIELRRSGLDVTVVAPLESLSRRLRMVASRVVSFADLSPEGPPAASALVASFGLSDDLGRAA